MCHSLKIYVLFPGNIRVIPWKYMCYSLEIYVLFYENIRVIPWKYTCYFLEIYVFFSGAPFCAIYNLSFVQQKKNSSCFFARNLSTHLTLPYKARERLWNRASPETKWTHCRMKNKINWLEDEEKLEVFLIAILHFTGRTKPTCSKHLPFLMILDKYYGRKQCSPGHCIGRKTG